jgi:hypothetical protein
MTEFLDETEYKCIVQKQLDFILYQPCSSMAQSQQLGIGIQRERSTAPHLIFHTRVRDLLPVAFLKVRAGVVLISSETVMADTHAIPDSAYSALRKRYAMLA